MMSKIPLVSVLMTAYNREKYIAEAIESVLASTFEDFELIIVDDCSKDRTVEIARQYESDPRVRVYLNEKNLGDYPNRNRAAELAKGKYLKYVDSDDFIYPHGLEVMVDTMGKFPDAALGIECSSTTEAPYPMQISSSDAYYEHYLQGGLFMGGPTTAIISTKAFRHAGAFSGKRFVGDTEMWLRLAARYPVVKMIQGLTWRREHEWQEQKIEYSAADLHAAMRYKIALAALTDEHCPLSLDERDRVIQRFKQGHGRILLSLAFRKHSPLIALRRIKLERFSIKDLLLAFLPGRIL